MPRIPRARQRRRLQAQAVRPVRGLERGLAEATAQQGAAIGQVGRQLQGFTDVVARHALVSDKLKVVEAQSAAALGTDEIFRDLTGGDTNPAEWEAIGNQEFDLLEKERDFSSDEERAVFRRSRTSMVLALRARAHKEQVGQSGALMDKNSNQIDSLVRKNPGQFNDLWEAERQQIDIAQEGGLISPASAKARKAQRRKELSEARILAVSRGKDGANKALDLMSTEHAKDFSAEESDKIINKVISRRAQIRSERISAQNDEEVQTQRDLLPQSFAQLSAINNESQKDLSPGRRSQLILDVKTRMAQKTFNEDLGKIAIAQLKGDRAVVNTEKEQDYIRRIFNNEDSDTLISDMANEPGLDPAFMGQWAKFLTSENQQTPTARRESAQAKSILKNDVFPQPDLISQTLTTEQKVTKRDMQRLYNELVDGGDTPLRAVELVDSAFRAQTLAETQLRFIPLERQNSLESLNVVAGQIFRNEIIFPDNQSDRVNNLRRAQMMRRLEQRTKFFQREEERFKKIKEQDQLRKGQSSGGQ